MKLLILLSLLSLQAYSSESNLYQKLQILSQMYDRSPELFGGVKLGVEQGITDCTISQEHILSELTRQMPDDIGYCEYQNSTNLDMNLSRITNLFSDGPLSIIKNIYKEDQIEHISSRSLVRGNESCPKQQIYVVLQEGYLLWIDQL